MINEIVALYSIIDDLLQAVGHHEDSRSTMSDAEVITAALAAARYFGGNQAQACQYLHEQHLMPKMLSASRFNRRLHALDEFIYTLQQQLGLMLMQLNDTTEYLLDSVPIALCDNIRIAACRLVHNEDYRGYIASKKRYFYGIRIHLISTPFGIPVEWVFLPGAASDVRGLGTLPLNLPAESELYADKAFTDYTTEDNLQQLEQIRLLAMRKSNAKRSDSGCMSYIKQVKRHFIETVFSQITLRFPKSIHATTFKGFLLKVSCFIWVYTLERAFL